MSEPGIRVVSQALIEELMGAVVAVDIVLQTLMGLPAEPLPGDEKSDAIRELLTASACHEVEAVGEEACRAAITLIEKVVDRIADDARAAADLAGATHFGPAERSTGMRRSVELRYARQRQRCASGSQ